MPVSSVQGAGEEDGRIKEGGSEFQIQLSESMREGVALRLRKYEWAFGMLGLLAMTRALWLWEESEVKIGRTEGPKWT